MVLKWYGVFWGGLGCFHGPMFDCITRSCVVFDWCKHSMSWPCGHQVAFYRSCFKSINDYNFSRIRIRIVYW